MTGDGGSAGSDQPRSRRSYLKLAGLATTALGLGGVTWVVKEAEDSHRVVNLADHDIDGDGQDPIDVALEDVAADDTTVRLPEGTYRLESFRPGPLSNFTLEGDDATLVPPEGSTDVIVGLIGNGLTLRGFTFDYTAENTAPQVIVRCSDGLAVENCEFVGVADVMGGQGRSAHEYHLMPAITHPDGEGVVRNVRLADGSVSPSNRGGIWVSGDSAGHLRFENVHLERWANNSLYVSESEGGLEVVGCRFVNNDVSGPRIGAATAKIRDTAVISDSWVPVQAFTGSRTSRGLWIDDACHEATVTNCRFRMTGPYADNAIVFEDWSDSQSGTWLFPEFVPRLMGRTCIEVQNCQFVMGDGLHPIEHVSKGATITTHDIKVRAAR